MRVFLAASRRQLRAAACADFAPARSVPALVRHKSSEALSSSSSAPPPQGCPVHHQHDGDSHPAAAGHHPKLVRVPSLPYIGSLLPFHSGIPNLATDPYKFFPAMAKKFGGFYSMGLPSIGNPDDTHATLYVIRDPTEMMKVVRGGGAYPSGLVQHLWPNKRWSMENGVLAGAHDLGLFGQGEDWKRIRTFLQTDLLHPASAKGYVPGIIRAAQLASKGAAHVSLEQSSGQKEEALNHFFARASFDMFSALMFGQLTDTADISTPTDAENVEFVESTKLGLSTSIQMLVDPFENIVGNVLGLKSKRYGIMDEGFTKSYSIGKRKIAQFIEKKGRGELDEYESNSYLARAIERQKEEGCGITDKELQDVCFTQLFAAVDTTMTAVGWNTVHMALNPKVQEKLYAELKANVDSEGSGELTASVLDRKKSPYLHSFIRETHRLTPSAPIYVFKRIMGPEPVSIHGETLAPGSVVAMEGLSASFDPNLVEGPKTFNPDRWSEEQVERRKGTPSEIIDHVYYKDAFSQGPRKCPGSRVATNEMLALLSQLVLDWKISMPNGINSLDDVKYEQRTSVEPIIPALVFEPR